MYLDVLKCIICIHRNMSVQIFGFPMSLSSLLEFALRLMPEAGYLEQPESSKHPTGHQYMDRSHQRMMAWKRWYLLC